MSVGLKNVCLTWRLPGASRKIASSAASTTTVLAVERTSPRRSPELSSRDRRADRSGSPCASAIGLRLDGRDADVDLQVLRRQPGQRAVTLQRGQRLVHAANQRVTLREQQAVVLAGRRELSHHDGAGDLRGRYVLSGRRIGDQRRDLLGLQRLLDVVQRLEDLRNLGRLDLAVDEGQA